MKMRTMLTIFLLLVTGFSLYVIYDVSTESVHLRQENQKLKKEKINLKKTLDRTRNISDNVCMFLGNYQGTPFYIDCGASFVPRYATCICTTMCLADYALTYNNLALDDEDCPRWHELKFELKPTHENEEENGEEN